MLWSAGVRYLALLAVFGLVSCGGTKNAVEIRQFHLRTTTQDTGGVESIRAEIRKRLHGAVSATEQRNRLGHYYTIRWVGPKGREADSVRLVFAYRQATTGSEIKRMVIERPGSRKGGAELQITGPQYLQGGRVLAWHLSFYRGDDLIQTRQSYLWE